MMIIGVDYGQQNHAVHSTDVSFDQFPCNTHEHQDRESNSGQPKRKVACAGREHRSAHGSNHGNKSPLLKQITNRRDCAPRCDSYKLLLHIASSRSFFHGISSGGHAGFYQPVF